VLHGSFDLEKEMIAFPWEHITKREILVAMAKLTGSYDRFHGLFRKEDQRKRAMIMPNGQE